MRIRNWAFDRGLRGEVHAPIPVVSIGNVLVGGTGKTPVSAWIVGRLRAQGRRPALVTRGYGNDEVALHRRWNPDVSVITAARRTDGVQEAARGGADVAVLDDGFQHRALARDLDIVLLPAEGPIRGRFLPRGPFRESPRALRRADIVVVTQRTATDDEAREVAEEARMLAPGALVARISLEAADWTDLNGGAASDPEGSEVLAVSSVARPELFRTLVEARVDGRVELMAFGDHHDYDAVDARRIAEKAGRRPVVTTEKDAVKLLPYRLELRNLRVLPLRMKPIEGAHGLERALGQLARTDSRQGDAHGRWE